MYFILIVVKWYIAKFNVKCISKKIKTYNLLHSAVINRNIVLNSGKKPVSRDHPNPSCQSSLSTINHKGAS